MIKKNKYNISSTKGFTLVELLVVISIIALLLSILMPSLRRAREQARSVVCSASLRSWGQIFSMYAVDNNGSFGSPYFDNDPKHEVSLWMKSLRPYYPPEKGYCCASAKKPVAQLGEAYQESKQTATSAWGVFQGGYWAKATGSNSSIFGSYGVNEWIHDRKSDQTYNSYYWRRNDVKGSGRVPIMLDALWPNAWPHSSDKPAFVENTFEWGWANNMKRFCVNRHIGSVNAVFMDNSVGKVKLKELWELKWSRKYDINYVHVRNMVWPPWMKKL